jgi:hypothetical protein
MATEPHGPHTADKDTTANTNTPDFLQHISKLTKELGVPDGALLSLISDNDWSAIIKSHALIEGAMTLLLTSALDEAALSPAFSRLPLGEDITGKLAFAKALGLLQPKERRFIKRLSELRNMLAHDPHHLGFTLKAYVEGMDKNQFKTFQDTLMFGVAPDQQDKVRERIRTNTRSAFHVTVLYFLSELLRRIHLVRVCAYLTPTERRRVFEAIGTEGRNVFIMDGAVILISEANPVPPIAVFYPQHHRDCAVFEPPRVDPVT